MVGEQAAAKGELDSAEHGIRHLLRRHLEGAMPPLEEMDSDDDDEEEARAAANVQRFRAAPAAADAAGGHAGALDELNRLLQQQAGLGNEEAEGQDGPVPGMLLESDDSEDEGALAPLP